MLPAVIWAHWCLSHSSAGFSAGMQSTGVAQSSVVAKRVPVFTGSTDAIRKQQNVDHIVAMLEGEGLSVTGTMCHMGKAEIGPGGVDFLVRNTAVNPLVGCTVGASEQVWDKLQPS
ncbi:dehydrogenase/reductase SDR family member 2-like protein [Cricetulus griseus]|nr:dehydrogenase/reductase SDR family member 2-like protein [Cricetulus griseus]